MAETKPIQIFLCHASEDKAAVLDIYDQLKALGYKPWLDKKDLLPGQLWEEEIPKAIRASDFILIFLSENSIPKRGYVQTEFKLTLDAWTRVPQGMIHTIPVRIDDSEIPDQFRKFHWRNLFEADGFENLLRALPQPSRPSAVTRQPFEPEMIRIRAGEFLMGSDPRKDKDAEDDEQPQHTLYLPDFSLAKTPITKAQYAAFVQAASHEQPPDWADGKPPRGKEEHPVVNVTWSEAVTYCHWLSKVTGKRYGLPSEAEWEKGAQGTDGRIYPWGNQWDVTRCNAEKGFEGDATPVEAHSQGASPYGVLDMAGNVWEWTRSLRANYPYNPEDGRENLDAPQDVDWVLRVLRGGAFSSAHGNLRCAFRYRTNPHYRRDRVIGFRVVVRP
jgi:formylglycine-generating enzyme required for sulfatase activity